MKILPRNYVLIAVATALGVLTFTREPGAPASRTVGPLIANFDQSAAAEVEIIGADGARTTITRVDGKWTVGERFGAPASETIVEAVLQRLGAITDLDLLTDEGASDERVRSEYGLGEDEALRIRVSAADGASIADVLIARASGAGQAGFVRTVGSNRVVRTPSLFLVPTDPDRWIDRKVLIAPSGLQLSRLQLEGPALGGALDVVVPKGMTGIYENAAGEKLPRRAVEEILEQLAVLPTAAVGGAAMAAEVEAPPLVIDVTPLVGVPYRLSVLDLGDPSARKERPGKVFRHGVGIVFAVDPERLARALELARSLL